MNHLDIATFLNEAIEKDTREIWMIEKYAFTRGAKTDF